MRNAMIFVSVLLAAYLAWPLAFGDAERGFESPAEARAVAIVVPKPRFVPASVAVDPVAPTRPESCYKRYQREVRQCVGSAAAGCRIGAADHWDICEATGFWPE